MFIVQISVGIMGLSGIPQETSPPQEEQAGIWKARLREYPPWEMSMELDFLYKEMKEAEKFNRDRMDVPDDRVFRAAIC